MLAATCTMAGHTGILGATLSLDYAVGKTLVVSVCVTKTPKRISW